MRGFTLIEVIVVFSIISLILATMLINYRGGSRSIESRNSAQEIAQSIRSAQNKALGGECTSSSCRFGVHFDISKTFFVIFEDGAMNLNGKYDAGEEVETIQLGSNILITSFSSSYACGLSSCADVLFTPPDPAISFMPQGVNSLTISITGGKSVVVEKTGSIDIN